jgi:hypothetical protein
VITLSGFQCIKNFDSTNSTQTEVIESTWRKRTENNSRIYNASKFRLAGIQLDGVSNKLELKVGLTSYKEILGTHYSDVTKELQEEANAASKNGFTSKGEFLK